jgi:hypothetical protein
MTGNRTDWLTEWDNEEPRRTNDPADLVNRSPGPDRGVFRGLVYGGLLALLLLAGGVLLVVIAN